MCNIIATQSSVKKSEKPACSAVTRKNETLLLASEEVADENEDFVISRPFKMATNDSIY